MTPIERDAARRGGAHVTIEAAENTSELKSKKKDAWDALRSSFGGIRGWSPERSEVARARSVKELKDILERYASNYDDEAKDLRQAARRL